MYVIVAQFSFSQNQHSAAFQKFGGGPIVYKCIF